MRMHRGEKIYKCIQCDKLFGQAAHLKTHLDYHAGVRKFSCEHCNKSFTQSSHLNIHKRTQHSSVKPYKCKYCSKEFGYLFGLTSHSHKNLTFKNDIEVQKNLESKRERRVTPRQAKNPRICKLSNSKNLAQKCMKSAQNASNYR